MRKGFEFKVQVSSLLLELRPSGLALRVVGSGCGVWSCRVQGIGKLLKPKPLKHKTCCSLETLRLTILHEPYSPIAEALSNKPPDCQIKVPDRKAQADNGQAVWANDCLGGFRVWAFDFGFSKAKPRLSPKP